jgi:YVTN family beta-propeller protein
MALRRTAAVLVAALVAACGSGGESSEARSPSASPSASPSPVTGPVGPLDGTATEVVGKVEIGGQPCGVLVAAGAVWVTDAQEGLLRRIDPVSHRVLGTTSVSPTPCELTTGFGSLWVATQSGSLDRVDPSTGRVVKRIAVGAGSYEPVVAFGHVWVSNRNSSTISEVDPATNRVVATVPTPGLLPGGLVEAGGALWVGNDTGGGKELARLDPSTLRLTRFASAARPSFVAVAAGRVWVASEDEGSVTPYDPRSGTPTGPALPAGVRPVNLAGALDREVWVPDDVGNLVTRIDARTGVVVERLAVCRGPAVVAPGGRDVWVTCFEDGAVWHLRPGTRA